jgi:hypothetical protein
MLTNLSQKHTGVPVIIITREMKDFVTMTYHMTLSDDCELLYHFTLEEEGNVVMQSESNYPLGIIYHVGVLGRRIKYKVENMTKELIKEDLVQKTNSVYHYTCYRDEGREAPLLNDQKQLLVARSLSRTMWATIFAITIPGMWFSYTILSFIYIFK